MNKKAIILVIVLGLLLGGTGFVVYKALAPAPKMAKIMEEQAPQEEIEPLASTVAVSVTKSRIKDNTIVLGISGLQSKYSTVAYELSYDSLGIVQGVTTKPLDISGKNTFTRDDIYLGTCSRNVCRPHPGVKKVSLVLEFTDSSGKKSQFSKEYDF